MATAFLLVFVAAAPFWALMIFAPSWRVTKAVTATPWIVVPSLAFWFVLALPRFGELLPAVAKPTLAGWQDLMTDPAVLTFMWSQIIAWDLFLGRWMYLDSRERGIHPLVMGPLLVLAIMLSPLAVVLYLVLRTALTSADKQVPERVSRPAVPV